jgi:hypothetical protein
VQIASASPQLNDPSRLSVSADMFSFDFGDTVAFDGDFLILQVFPIPEPSTALLMACSAIAMLGFRRRRL